MIRTLLDDEAGRPYPGDFEAVRGRAGTLWAVGSTDPATFPADIVGQWTGSAWTWANNANMLAAVPVDVTLSPSYLWAVDQSRVWRRDGAGTWTLADTATGTVATPAEPVFFNTITGSSDSDIYASGDYHAQASPPTRNLRHWNGTAWGDVALPGSTATEALYITDLDFDPGGGLWIAGYGGPLSGATSAMIGSLAAGLTTYGALTLFVSVWAHSSSDQWALGVYRNTGGGFTAVAGLPALPADALSGGAHHLNAIHGTSASDVWAVGFYTTTGRPYDRDLLLWHWDGSTWTATARPALASDITRAWALDVYAAASNDVWAVGQLHRSSGNQPLAYHWDGSAWTDRSPTI